MYLYVGSKLFVKGIGRELIDSNVPVVGVRGSVWCAFNHKSSRRINLASSCDLFTKQITGLTFTFHP